MTHPDRNRQSGGPESATPAVALRTATAAHHRRAERAPFQRLLVSGRLPRATYVGWLQQMYCIYRGLEAVWPRSDAGLRGLIASRRRTPELERDLAFLEAWPVPPDPLPTAARFVARLAQWADRGPAELIGVLYVLEGSSNGSRHIARALHKAYGLQGTDGLGFLDPYGEAQPERWREFKTRLDALLDADQVAAAVAGAQATFDLVTALGDDLLAAAGGNGLAPIAGV